MFFCFGLSNETLPHELQHFTPLIHCRAFQEMTLVNHNFPEKENRLSTIKTVANAPETQCLHSVCARRLSARHRFWRTTFQLLLCKKKLKIFPHKIFPKKSTNEHWRYSSAALDKQNFYNQTQHLVTKIISYANAGIRKLNCKCAFSLSWCVVSVFSHGGSTLSSHSSLNTVLSILVLYSRRALQFKSSSRSLQRQIETCGLFKWSLYSSDQWRKKTHIYIVCIYSNFHFGTRSKRVKQKEYCVLNEMQ